MGNQNGARIRDYTDQPSHSAKKKLEAIFNRHKVLTLETVVKIFEGYLNVKVTEADYSMLTQHAREHKIRDEQHLSYNQFQQVCIKLCQAHQKWDSFKKLKVLDESTLTRVLSHNKLSRPETALRNDSLATQPIKEKYIDHVNIFWNLRPWKEHFNGPNATASVIISETGSLREGKPTNQDKFLTCALLGEDGLSYLFGVLDGHGITGHLVSTFLADEIVTSARRTPINSDEPAIWLKQIIRGAITNLYNSPIPTELSGSTLCLAFLHKNMVYVSNIGDSKALICNLYDESRGLVKCVELTMDHKPSRQDEYQRITGQGGIISRSPGMSSEPFNIMGEEVLRVWCPGCNYPGLAMSRTIGDTIGHTAGIIDTPEVSSYALSSEDQCILLGTDGIFDMVPPKEAIQNVFSNLRTPRHALSSLIRNASKHWKEKTKYADDISGILVVLG